MGNKIPSRNPKKMIIRMLKTPTPDKNNIVVAII
jgi:hypothetical protein